jgi:hypothetical protein
VRVRAPLCVRACATAVTWWHLKATAACRTWHGVRCTLDGNECGTLRVRCRGELHGMLCCSRMVHVHCIAARCMQRVACRTAPDAVEAEHVVAAVEQPDFLPALQDMLKAARSNHAMRTTHCAPVGPRALNHRPMPASMADARAARSEREDPHQIAHSGSAVDTPPPGTTRFRAFSAAHFRRCSARAAAARNSGAVPLRMLRAGGVSGGSIRSRGLAGRVRSRLLFGLAFCFARCARRYRRRPRGRVDRDRTRDTPRTAPASPTTDATESQARMGASSSEGTLGGVRGEGVLRGCSGRARRNGSSRS